MKLKPLNAFAWVVDDIESAALQWTKNAGVGPFFISEYCEGDLEQTRYRGTSSPITMKTALAQAGDMQIELVEDTAEIRAAFKMIAASSINWDGSSPVRSFGEE